MVNVVKIFCIFVKIIFMYKNMMDSMKKPKMEKMMPKKAMPKHLVGKQSKLDSEDFKMLRK